MAETHCPVCKHAKVAHNKDGLGYTCIVCAFMNKENRLHPVCGIRYNFKLSQRERDQAKAASRDIMPQWTVCAECGDYWVQHFGMLCPSGDSTFLPLLDIDTGGGLIQ